ncbi:hypothetical protein [Ideonella paludis]|uniref:Secreted protein n=1 Tax=Ideonella paludis TaxID=1233411 RepID=A0ABS5DTJ3_9BURK|nr:hypothetical protein [Ideonella paludis]MBQ0934464.1 hypothetical protein [Ideonella paludis]
MRKTFHALSALALTTVTLAAQATPPEQWEIIEGHGLTDNAVYLGQPRKQLIQRSKSCKKPATECTFRIEPSAQDITVFFNAKSKVERIRFRAAAVAVQNCQSVPLPFTWPTSKGADFTWGVPGVADLYPGSTWQCSFGYCTTEAQTHGLRFEMRHTNDECDLFYDGTFEVIPKQP